MKCIKLSSELIKRIQSHGEKCYPEEGAGFLLGRVDSNESEVHEIIPIMNAREKTNRHNRYLITPEDMLSGEQTAIEFGLDVIGVFHSHPDHPEYPSEFDREWALPWYSYLITSVQDGMAKGSRSWKLLEDHSAFEEEKVIVLSERVKTFES